MWAADAIAVFGVINIVYARLRVPGAEGPQEAHRLLVGHRTWASRLLGMAAFTPPGISGAVFQMFTHGIISPMLFLIVGVIYDRAHHREIASFGGLAQELPEYSGHHGARLLRLARPARPRRLHLRVLVFSGAFPVFTTFTIISAIGVIITAAYYLWTIQRMFLGKLNPNYKGFPDLNWRERLTLYPLGVIAIVLGFYPQAILGSINSTLHVLIQNLRPL